MQTVTIAWVQTGQFHCVPYDTESPEDVYPSWSEALRIKTAPAIGRPAAVPSDSLSLVSL